MVKLSQNKMFYCKSRLIYLLGLEMFQLKFVEIILIFVGNQEDFRESEDLTIKSERIEIRRS